MEPSGTPISCWLWQMFDPIELAALTYELVRIPSVTGNEQAIAADVESRCRALPGVRVERLGNAVLARVGAIDVPAIALVGHLDTVPPWAGHEPTISGTRVIGRGAADMKGGDAVMLAVLERCALDSVPVVAVFYDREEGPNRENGIHEVLDRSTLLGSPVFAFVGEPTSGTIHAGCVGVLNADVVFEGRTAHSARPWEGENAVLAAAPFLEVVRAHTQRAVSVEGLEFFDTLSVTEAHGGIARNVVPDRFTLGVNARFAPGREAREVRAEIEAMVGEAGSVEWLDESPPAMPALADPTLGAFLSIAGVPVFPKQAWTDVATLAARGIPAANYGPGEPSQAHQHGEWVDGEAIADVAGKLMRFLSERRRAGGTL